MLIRDMALILVPTDFSPVSDHALDAAMDVARLTGAALELIHINGDPTVTLPPLGDGLVFPVEIEDAGMAASTQLDAIVARVRKAGISCTAVSHMGRIHSEIVEYAAKRRAGMIVVGIHAKGAIGHALLGSVAEKVVRTSPCPVLVVPSEPEAEEAKIPADDEVLPESVAQPAS